MPRSQNHPKTPLLACLAILVVLATLAVSLSAQEAAPARINGLAVAGPDRPAVVPAGYVITPFGYFHPSCVQSLAEGATLLADGRVQHPNGTAEANARACGYPHFTRAGALVTENLKAATGEKVPAINGWLEYVQSTTDTSYGEITATWTVPPLPSVNDSQTVFFFPGFEDIDNQLSIVQPVLQWYPPGPWGIASWNCCMQGTVWHSAPKKVKPGDSILGTIISTCKPGLDYCAKWKIISEDVTTGKKTTLAKGLSEGQIWNWGFAAVLEAYGVRQCSDFPANNSVDFSVQLYDHNRKLIADPGWTAVPADPGTTPNCPYGLIVSPTEETLEY